MIFPGFLLKERSTINNPICEDPGQVGPTELKMEAVCLGDSLVQQLLLAHMSAVVGRVPVLFELAPFIQQCMAIHHLLIHDCSWLLELSHFPCM